MSYQGSFEGSGHLKKGGQIIHTGKYADDLVLLAKEEKVLQDMIDKRMTEHITEHSTCPHSSSIILGNTSTR